MLIVGNAVVRFNAERAPRQLTEAAKQLKHEIAPDTASMEGTCSTSIVAGVPSSSRQLTASPRGRATGADIWRLRDQTGNGRAAAERNEMVEGVSERVEFEDADARDRPFPPGSFDVVLSNLTFSNIRGSVERVRALREAVRVLRAGGRMRVVDEHAGRYGPVLQGAGCVDVEVGRLDWRTWCGLPGHHFTLVSASKPAAGSHNFPQLAQ